MKEFTIYDASGVEYVKDMLPTIEKNLPNFNECWNLLTFFIEDKQTIC